MKRTSEELRKSYEEALERKMTAEQIIEECANRILEVRNETRFRREGATMYREIRRDRAEA